MLQPASETSNPERPLDLPQGLEIMRKPVGTVRYYIHNRTLPAMKVGKSYLIKLKALLDWVDVFNQKEPAKGYLANRNRKERINAV